MSEHPSRPVLPLPPPSDLTSDSQTKSICVCVCVCVCVCLYIQRLCQKSDGYTMTAKEPHSVSLSTHGGLKGWRGGGYFTTRSEFLPLSWTSLGRVRTQKLYLSCHTHLDTSVSRTSTDYASLGCDIRYTCVHL